MKWVTATESMTTRQIFSAKSWTVMRFSETTQNDKLEWLIRKDGCMHCADPGCLKACPSPGAIIQYANGIVDFQSEHCIGCGYCIAGCPFNIPGLILKIIGSINVRCALTGSLGQEPALRENLSDRCYPVWNQKRDA